MAGFRFAVAMALAFGTACGEEAAMQGQPSTVPQGPVQPLAGMGPVDGPAQQPPGVNMPPAGPPAPGQQPGQQPGPMQQPPTAMEPAMDGPSDAPAPSNMDMDNMDMDNMDPVSTPMGTLPPVDSVDGMGPFAVTIERGASPGGGWVAYPTDLGKDGLKHPIFLWGCGGGSQPSQYEDHLNQIASHGFVMEAHVSSGDASDHEDPLAWLLAQNDDASSAFHGKLDVTKVAAGGHSMGSIATFAFEGDTDALTTSIHVAGGSFDGNGYMRLKTPTLMVNGMDDTLAGSNTARDFERTTVPTFYVNIEDTDHIYAARNGLPVMIAWLRWHLGGEVERKDMFVVDNCEFCGGKWNGMAKNF